MGQQVEVTAGVWKELQGSMPVFRPEGAETDCAYCAEKQFCKREFFVGQKYAVCSKYFELNEQVKKEERIKELSKVFNPTPRPENADRDCLHCRWLPERKGAVCGQFGPYQGTGEVCNRFYDIPVRLEGEPQHCKNCYHNFRCPSDRVMRIGEPCERYKEI